MAWASYFKDAQKFLKTAIDADVLEKARVAARDMADAASKITENVQAEYKKTFEDLDCKISNIQPDLLVIEYPSDDKIDRLASRLNSTYSDRMLILNLSGSQYHAMKFNGKVVDVELRELPFPPLEVVMEHCLSAQKWLASSHDNVFIVHCHKGYSRSAAFLGCFLCFRGEYTSPADALRDVCRALAIDEKSSIFPSERRYLVYFQRVLQGVSPTLGRLRLQRVQLNGVPTFESDDIAVKPYVEIWNRGKLIFSSLGNDKTPAVTFSSSDPCVSFLFSEEVLVSTDVLVRIYHVNMDGSKAIVLSSAFHTGFLHDGFQLAKHELDSACNDVRFSQDSFFDLIFEKCAQESDEKLPDVFARICTVSKRLAQEEIQRRETESKAAVAAGKTTVDQNRDEFAELEALLSRPRSDGSPTAEAADGASASSGPASGFTNGAPESNPNGTGNDCGEHFSPPPRNPSAPADTAASSTDIATVPAADESFSAEAKSNQGDAIDKGGRALNTSSESVPRAAPELEDLFGEFDAALASFGVSDTAAQSPAVKVLANEANEGTKPAKPQTSTLDAEASVEDMFGDVDAFLADLDNK